MSLPLLPEAAPTAPAPHIGALQLFLTFSRITLSGFGGMPFWTRRALVERQRWLTEREFVELMAIGQLLPGPGTLNLAVMVGQRFAGGVGAIAAVAGLLGWPALIMIALGTLYQRYGALPFVHHALTGMSAVGAGLLLASGIRMAAVLARQWRPWLFAGLAFAGVGIGRWSLIAVVGVLAPFAIAAAWKEPR
jgi:chromate transporter